jgi:hypothetical protein
MAATSATSSSREVVTVDDARVALLVPIGGPGHPLAGVIPHVRHSSCGGTQEQVASSKLAS